MRLIDADAEVERLQKVIEELKKQIECYDNNKSTIRSAAKDILHFRVKINYIQNNIAMLQSCDTAYDLDILLNGLNEILKDEISQPIADCVYECVMRGSW